MHTRIRRAVTTFRATVGGLALLTGTASAHFCYFYNPDKSQLERGEAWHTGEELTAWIEDETAGWPPARLAGRDHVLAQIAEISADGGVFKGPGVLAGGTLRKAASTPQQLGHLDFSQVPRSCFD